jgi:hypothetical protein
MRKYELGVANELSELRVKIELTYPANRERSLALTKLDECIMWLSRAKLNYGEAPEQDAKGRDFGQPT